MSFENFYRAARHRLADHSPSAQAIADTIEFDRLISPHRLELPKQIADLAQAGISAHYQLGRKPSFQKKLAASQPWLADVPVQTDAVLMSYDFHTTASGEAYLVEVNTNASSFLLTCLMYEAHGLPAQWKGRDAKQALLEAFKSEVRGGQSFALIDDQLLEQKMYFEFLMYKDLFDQSGWPTELVDASELNVTNNRLCSPSGEAFDFVYNRTTDFYFAEAQHAALRTAYARQLALFSPHPWAYLLFADKERLTELSLPGWLEAEGLETASIEALRRVLIPTYEMAKLGSNEDIWNRRKSLFFKPKRSHGGKSVYRGSSVSRKVFERMMSEETVVQEFVPAQSWPTSKSDAYMDNWKFDLRFFVYRDQIQLAAARTYQGQVTNFSSQYGGMTAVEFV